MSHLVETLPIRVINKSVVVLKDHSGACTVATYANGRQVAVCFPDDEAHALRIAENLASDNCPRCNANFFAEIGKTPYQRTAGISDSEVELTIEQRQEIDRLAEDNSKAIDDA